MAKNVFLDNILEGHLTPTLALPELRLWLGLHLLTEESVLKEHDSVNSTGLKSLQASLFEDKSFLSIYLLYEDKLVPSKLHTNIQLLPHRPHYKDQLVTPV